MATFNEMMQKLVNSDYETLVSIAQEALVGVLPACKEVDPDNGGIAMATSIILSAIAADGVLTGLEKKFLADALGLNQDAINQLIGLYDRRMAEMVDVFVDHSNPNVKAEVLALVSAVAAVDEKISHQETAFIKKLLA
ncbi:MAG: hypothetical protein IKC09_01230 [Oscillospiraceae bacterium]|nr:hypothetical protein [Oscillospiraceae bacterium]